MPTCQLYILDTFRTRRGSALVTFCTCGGATLASVSKTVKLILIKGFGNTEMLLQDPGCERLR